MIRNPARRRPKGDDVFRLLPSEAGFGGGDTGLKGRWLTNWLLRVGAGVIGVFGGVRTRRAIFEGLAVGGRIRNSLVDPRDLDAICGLNCRLGSGFVFQLAA